MARVVVVAEDLSPDVLPADVLVVKGDPRESKILIKAHANHARHARHDEFVIEEHAVDSQYIGLHLNQLRAHYDGFVLGLAQGKEVALGVKRSPIVQEGDQVLCLQVHKPHK